MPNLQKEQAIVQPTPKTPPEKRGNGAFVQVPVELLRGDNLSPAALKLYMILLSYCGPKAIAWPSQERLAQDMHLSERRVRGLMTELGNAGIVYVKHCIGSSNTYVVQKYSLGGGEQNESVTTPFEKTAEENFRVERKKISAHVHELEFKNLCEEKADKTGNVTRETYRSDGASVENEFTILVDLFVSSGMSLEMGLELAQVSRKNNRDDSYVNLLIEASHSPEVHNPIGFIRFMVLRNAEPTMASKRGIKHSQPRSKTLANQPLDFTKYTSGKYAYLTNPKISAITLNQIEEDPPQFKAAPVVSSHFGPLPLGNENKSEPPMEVETSFIGSVEALSGSDNNKQTLANRPAHLKVRQEVVKVFGLEEAPVLAEWNKILKSLENSSQVRYFYPALGWLVNSNEPGCYQVVFRNKFDRRLGERWLALLIERLKVLYGPEIEVSCQSLDGV